MKKRLIEYDLPLADISEASAKEKNIRHGHPSTLHIWWARRPLAASRATAFAALIDDPGPDEPGPPGSGFATKREYLMDLIRRMTPWEAVKDGNSDAIEEARRLIREQYGAAPKVLDPFAGGGSIPLEALRLGCETYASDYNPVAVLVEKATLEWPQKFGVSISKQDIEAALDSAPNPDGKPVQFPFATRENEQVNLLAYMVQRWMNIIKHEAETEIGRFFPCDQTGWIPVCSIWARTIPCQNPACGCEIPLIKQFWLAKSVKKAVALMPIPDIASRTIQFDILEDTSQILAAGFDPSQGTTRNGDAYCPLCGQITGVKHVRQLSREGKMSQRMIAVVLHHSDQTGKKYRIANEADIMAYEEASAYFQDLVKLWPFPDEPVPTEQLPPVGTLGFRVNRYGIL